VEEQLDEVVGRSLKDCPGRPDLFDRALIQYDQPVGHCHLFGETMRAPRCPGGRSFTITPDGLNHLAHLELDETGDHPKEGAFRPSFGPTTAKNLPTSPLSLAAFRARTSPNLFITSCTSSSAIAITTGGLMPWAPPPKDGSR